MNFSRIIANSSTCCAAGVTKDIVFSLVHRYLGHPNIGGKLLRPYLSSVSVLATTAVIWVIQTFLKLHKLLQRGNLFGVIPTLCIRVGTRTRVVVRSCSKMPKRRGGIYGRGHGFSQLMRLPENIPSEVCTVLYVQYTCTYCTVQYIMIKYRSPRAVRITDAWLRFGRDA
jgi:hypothetical protein